MKLSELTQILNGHLQGADAVFKQIVIDSRIIQKGDCFFAIKGDFFDGHDFISDVAEKGAAVAVVDRDVFPIQHAGEGWGQGVSIASITVKNTRQALIDLAKYYRDHTATPVIGITGSCGKTTTRAMIENILKQCGQVLASQKSFNNDIGLPLTLLKLTPDHNFIVLEIGTNHPGEIAALTAIAQPTISVVTMVAGVHIEGFGSIEKIAAEKAEIYAKLPKQGIAIVNADETFSDYFKKIINDRRIITFGVKNTADLTAKDIQINENGTIHFRLTVADESITVHLPLLGEHNVTNALAAAAIAYALNIPLEKIKMGLETATPEYGRLNIKKAFNGATIIDDSYNANPTSVKAAIDVLTHQSNHSVLVLGDMKELGDGAETLHAEIGDYALKHEIKKLFCYGKMSAYAAKAFGKNAFYFEDQQELIDELKRVLTSDDTILVKGSNSMNMVNVVKGLTLLNN